MPKTTPIRLVVTLDADGQIEVYSDSKQPIQAMLIDNSVPSDSADYVEHDVAQPDGTVEIRGAIYPYTVDSDRPFVSAVFDLPARGTPTQPSKDIPQLTSYERYVLQEGPKNSGTYAPADVLGMYEESLTKQAYDRLEGFLNWVTLTKRTYGWATLDDRWREYQTDKTKRATNA